MTRWRSLNLRFPDRGTERAFWDAHLDANLPQMRLTVAIGPIDTGLRFGVAVPLIAAPLLLSFTRGFRRYWQPLYGFGLYVAVVVIVAGWSASSAMRTTCGATR